MGKDTARTVKKQKHEGQFKENDPRINRAGRPQGSRDFYTDFKEAIQKIKDKNSGESLTEQDIIKIGLEKMLKGDARFEGLYKDLLDRVYGKPIQKSDITTGGDKIFIMPPELIDKNESSPSTEPDSK